MKKIKISREELLKNDPTNYLKELGFENIHYLGRDFSDQGHIKDIYFLYENNVYSICLYKHRTLVLEAPCDSEVPFVESNRFKIKSYLVLIDRSKSKEEGRECIYDSLKLNGNDKKDFNTLGSFIIDNKALCLKDYIDEYGLENINLENKQLIDWIRFRGVYNILYGAFMLRMSNKKIIKKEKNEINN